MPKFWKRFSKKYRNTPEEPIAAPPTDGLTSGNDPLGSSTSASRSQTSKGVSSAAEDGPPKRPPRPNSAQPETNLQQTADQPQAPSGLLSSTEYAEKRLKEAAEKLEKVIPKEVLQSGKLEINGCADINTMADNVALAIGRLMNQRNIDESKQSAVKTLMKGWVKKALPFIQHGLSAASVLKLGVLYLLVPTGRDPGSLWINRIGVTLRRPGFAKFDPSHVLEPSKG